MLAPPEISRVIVVVLDGLRADAVPLFRLPHLTRLLEAGAGSLAARTVQPSITSAAMTSLLTGVSPGRHGITTDRFALPRRNAGLVALPHLLRQHGLRTHWYLAAPPRMFRGFAERIVETLGVTARFARPRADAILDAALDDLSRLPSGLFVLHWPDADRTGHARGWTSPDYAGAAARLDATLGALVDRTGLLDDPGTVLIALADHGGGGRVPRDHGSPHPLDLTIPIVLAGGSVARGQLAPWTSLLDVPATIAWALGAGVPSCYEGRALVEAFVAPAAVPLLGAA